MPTEPLYNEKDLLRRVAEDDEAAFRQVYEHHWNRVYSMGFLYLKSPVPAQDITQEAFLKVWIKRADLPALENFGAWLHVLARNLIITALRKKTELYGLDIGTLNASPENTLVPDQQVVVKEIAALIGKAIAQLPPQQQKIYRMSREQGLKLTEVARELGLSHNTVREHMSKALQNIRAYLKQHADLLGLLVLLFTMIS